MNKIRLTELKFQSLSVENHDQDLNETEVNLLM
jgi:hypothetical protein